MYITHAARMRSLSIATTMKQLTVGAACLLAIYLQLWIAQAQSSTGLLVSPQDQNVTLGATGRFSCGGTGVLVSWFINQHILDQQVISELGVSHHGWKSGGDVFSNITLPATAANNNSNVYCIVHIDFTSSSQSATSVLRVQGLLSAVGDLAIQYRTQDSTLSWTEPYSLQGIPITYTITVSNSMSNTEIVSTLTVTSTKHSFSSSMWTACNSYSFTVQAHNSAGAGGMSEVEKLFPGVPDTPRVSISDIIVSSTASVTLAIEVSSCFLQQGAMLTVSVQRDSDGQLIKNFTQTTFERTMFPVVITDLPVDTVYRSAVSVSNTLGSAVVRDISFSSYVVQDFSVTQSFTNGTTCLSCVLLRNGMTTGCLISMRHADQTLCRSEVELQLLLSNETTSTVANSSYLVSITGCTNQSQLVYEGAYSLYATSIGSSSMTHTSMQKMVRLKGLPCNASPSPATTSTRTNSEGVILPSVPSRGIGPEVYISSGAVAAVLLVIATIVTVFIIILVIVKIKRRKKRVMYTVNSRTQFTGTSVRIEEIPQVDHTHEHDTHEQLEQEDHLSNGRVEHSPVKDELVKQIMDYNPWHQQQQQHQYEQANEKAKMNSYRQSRTPSSGNEDHEERKKQQLQMTIVDEALKFRKEKMERLQYKNPLSTPIANDDDSDQMDYDHLTDEESSDSVFEDRAQSQGSLPNSHVTYFAPQRHQHNHHHGNMHHQQPHLHYQSTGYQYSTVNKQQRPHSFSSTQHHSNLPVTWQC